MSLSPNILAKFDSGGETKASLTNVKLMEILKNDGLKALKEATGLSDAEIDVYKKAIAGYQSRETLYQLEAMKMITEDAEIRYMFPGDKGPEELAEVIKALVISELVKSKLGTATQRTSGNISKTWQLRNAPAPNAAAGGGQQAQ
jgi:hypothetical protein